MPIKFGSEVSKLVVRHPLREKAQRVKIRLAAQELIDYIDHDRHKDRLHAASGMAGAARLASVLRDSLKGVPAARMRSLHVTTCKR